MFNKSFHAIFVIGSPGNTVKLGMATEDRFRCGEEQCQVGAVGGSVESDDAPLHFKLGLMKQFVTALEKESATFKYLQPELSEAKVNASVLVGTEIKIRYCKEFPRKLTRKEKAAWNSFVALAVTFWALTKPKTRWSRFRLW